MTDPWPRTATVAAARSELARPGAVADGFHALGVEPRDGELLVVFRWRRDPNTYGVRFGLPATPATSPWTGLPVHSARDWALEVAGWLMEELHTGLVRRAGRRRVGEVVELGPDEHRAWEVPGYYVSVSHWTLPGTARVLAAAGVGPARAAQLLAGGKLISSLDAYVDNLTASPVVGQAVIGWVAGRAALARLDVLTVDADAPAAIRRKLAHHAVHDATEAGATEIITTLTDGALRDIGFRPTPNRSGMLLDTTRMDQPAHTD